MNIDIIVAKLQKRGMSESNAKIFANKINIMSKEFGVPVSELVQGIQQEGTYICQ